jgi:AcrR family transcriptional regulator
MDVRAQRIVKSAIELAERDGYHAVRLRDVAQQAEVALATVYRRFQSKEDILIAALEHESENLQVRLRRRGMPGADPVARVVEFFRFVTHGLIRRPNLSRALIRALATTDSDVAVHGESAKELYAGLQKSSEGWCKATLEDVQATMSQSGYPASRIHYVRGRVEDTIPGTIPGQIAVLRLDTDWYESTRHELEHLYPRLVRGGILMIDDYGHWQGARRATDEYLKVAAPGVFLHRIDYTGREMVKP